MLNERSVDPCTDREWDAFVASHTCGHLLQSSAWGRFRSRWGWRSDRVAVRGPDGQIVAGAQCLSRATPLGKVTYVPRGPVCEPADEAWELLLNALHQIVRPGLALRIEPDWADEPSTRRWLLDQGLAEVDPVQPASTVLLDLRPSEDELLLGMKQKWRYNTRLAARRGVEVVAGDAGDVPEFGKLMTETGARDGFAPRPADYYADAKRAFGDAARLYLARRSGRTLAAIMVFHFGDTATYLYGASADQGRRHMPNHLLQWEAIRGAKRDGLRWYDFWGIPDELGRAAVAGTPLDEIPTGSGGLWGVWGFKRGFGGDVVRAVGAWDEVYSPTRYALGGALMRLRAAVQRHNPTGSA